MSKKQYPNPLLGKKALEMVMRDVLGGMEDLALMKSFEADRRVFQIISIESPRAEARGTAQPSVAVPALSEAQPEPLARVIPLKRSARAGRSSS